MFNINNLLNSPIQPTPWAHQKVTGFFETDAHTKISEGIQGLLATLDPNVTYDGDTNISIYQAKDSIGQEAFDIISEANESILNNISNIFTNYPNHRNYSSVMCIPSFSVIAPNHVYPFINDSAVDKVCNIVAFMTPNIQVETVLYKGNGPDTENETVINQYNTGMMYCPATNVTWFKYNSIAPSYVTLNFFVYKNVFDSITEVNGNYQYYTLEGQLVSIPINAASYATYTDAKAGKLVRNL